MSPAIRSGRLLLGCFIGISAGVSSIYFYSIGVFLRPLAHEFGWSHSQVSLGPLVGTLGAALTSIPTGRLMDRWGPRRLAFAALLLLASSFVALSVLTTGLASFLCVTALLSMLTVGSTPISFTRLIVANFERRRGVALGLTLAATGVGAMIIPPLLGPFIAANGWRGAYLLLAGIVAGGAIIARLLLAGEVGALPLLTGGAGRDGTGFALMRTRPFVLLAIIFLLAATGILGAVVQLPAMLGDGGMGVPAAGRIAGMIGIAMIGGRALCGYLLDRLPPALVTAAFFLISAAGLLTLAVGGIAQAPVAAVALGLSVGAEADLLAYLVSRIFPRAAYGTVYGALYSFFLAGVALGPALVGFGFDVSGSYRAPLLLLAGLTAAASLLSLALQVPALAPTPVDERPA